MKSYFILLVLAVLLSFCSGKHNIPTKEINNKLQNIGYESDCYYINEEYYDSLATKGVIIISEPHADVYTQVKLQEFLSTIHQKDSSELFNFYCLEGSKGDFKIDEFRDLFEKDTSKFFYSILDGKISGWEYQLLKNKNISAFGVEDKDIYQEQINTFGNFYSNLNKRLYDSYLLITDNLYRKLESKRTKIDNVAVKQILKGALNDIIINSDLPLDSFLVKYTYFINPLCNNQIDNKVKEALNDTWHIGNVTNAFKNHEYNTDFYNIVKQQLPDSAALISDIEKDINLFRVAYIRDSVMANNTINVLNKKNLQSTILFIGSFHKKGIINRFKENHISYVYFEHSSNHFDDSLYLVTLDNKSFNNTMKEPYMNPIIHPETKEQFITYINELTEFQTNDKITSFQKSMVEFLKEFKGKPKYTELTPGSSDERVFDVRLDENRSVIMKMYTEEEKASIEKNNVDILNEKAKELGIRKMYPDYYMIERGKSNTMILQEKIEALSFKEYLNQSGISQHTKDIFLKQYLKLTEEADNLYKQVLNDKTGNFILKENYKNSRQLYESILDKIAESKKLTSKLYTESQNIQMMEEYYKQLEVFFADIFKMEFDVKKGVYIDYNMQNCFINNVLIDPTDNCIGSTMKSNALKFKEIANFKFEFNTPIDDMSNQKIIDELLANIFKGSPSENEYKELIAHIFIFDFSDSKRILKDKSYIDILNGYNNIHASDKMKCECMASIPLFYYKDRSNKNYLLINLIKNYSSRFGKNLDKNIQNFEKNYKNKLEVNNFQLINKKNNNAQIS